MRKILFSLLTLLIVLASCGENSETTTINGTLLSCENQAMQAANVEAYIFNSKIDTVKIIADADGSFELEFEPSEMIIFQFFGSDHLTYRLTLYTGGIEEDFDLNVHLEAVKPIGAMTDVRVIGNFNHFDFEEGVPMTLQSDGTYETIVPNNSDTLFYQLLGISKGLLERSVNGTMHDFLVYDGAGDYRSAIITNDKEVKIIFDPSKKQYPQTTHSATSANRQIGDYIKSHISLIKLYNSSFRGLHQAISDRDVEKVNLIFNNSLSAVAELILKEKDRRILADQLLTYCEITETAARFAVSPEHDPAIKSLMFKELPATSGIWLGKHVLIPSAALIAGTEQTVTFLGKMPQSPISEERQVNIFYNSIELYAMIEDTATRNKIYELMEKFYPQHPETHKAGIKFADKGNIMIGKQIPKFSVKSVDNPNKTIISESLRGKYTLIDIWAVWCRPCLREMPHLHEAYEKFKDDNFQILSISFDKTIADVYKYRAGKWKMPWMNAFAVGGFSSKIKEIFEVSGIP
ncbi:MAG: TlpA family protein disulfide reductase, partial [Chlorobi bacterium]|nr:TlpA family protein disulfide reductase [Chlorobiota bacterium]